MALTRKEIAAIREKYLKGKIVYYMEAWGKNGRV